MLLRLLWSRKLTWKAHLDGTLHEAQAGSRPGKRAIDLVVFKEQKYLYSRLTRTPLLTMDNDAKACYDRIICNLAMLISQYFGMPSEACDMQAKTLQNMEFHLKTALGVSDEFYKHTNETPVHGSGQGSCASPTLWLLISTILMRCLEKGAPGMAIDSIQKDVQTLRSIIDGFVDDTSLFTNIPFHLNNMIDAIRNLQGATETWAELLEASGGKLELSKCFYYILNWKFNTDGEPLPMTIQDQQELNYPTITIRDSETGEEIKINQKECDCDHKTLGFQKNTLGNDKGQFTVLLNKSNSLAQVAHSSRMTKHYARTAFQMIYCSTMVYSLPACSFTVIQLEKMQAKAIEHFLPAMGWRRTSARALVHGPLELGGYNIPHLYAVQGAVKIISLSNHIKAQTELGKIFIININWLKLIVGRSTQIIADKYKPSYVTDNWLLNAQLYMQECHISIRSAQFWQPSMARRNDKFIMEAASVGTYNMKELRIINNWRIYFNAIRLSDLTDGSGKIIMLPYRRYEYTEKWKKIRQSIWRWPKQGQPGPDSFKLWLKFLNTEFRMQGNGMITNKVEHWYGQVSQNENIWNLYYDPVLEEIYEKQDYDYAVYNKHEGNRQSSSYLPIIIRYEIQIPRSAIPATAIQKIDQKIIFTYYKQPNEGLQVRGAGSNGNIS